MDFLSKSIYGNVTNPNQLYPIKDGNQIYLKDVDGNEIYGYIKHMPVFAKRGDEKYYAKTKDLSEYYPIHKTKEITITNSSVSGNNIIPTYAVNNKNEPMYPKRENNEEYIPQYGNYIKNSKGEIVYPLNGQGQPIYPKDRNGNEKYFKDIHIARDKNGKQIYARDAYLNEYYPANENFALDSSGVPIYAISTFGSVIFPKDKNGNEYYLKDFAKNDVIYFNNGQYINRYAVQNNKNEFYPKNVIYPSEDDNDILLTEIILKDYAKTHNGIAYYPLDEYGNEFTKYLENDNYEECFPIGYPITNDNFYILPTLFDKLCQIPGQEIDESHFVGKLFRESRGVLDILTDVYCTNRKSSSIKIPYKVLKIDKNEIQINTLNNKSNNVKSKSSRSLLNIIMYTLIFGFILGIGMFVVWWKNKYTRIAELPIEMT